MTIIQKDPIKTNEKTHKTVLLHPYLPVQSKSWDTEFKLCSESDCMFVVEAKSSMSFEVFPDTSTILNINKFALLQGEAQLCLPYVCLQKKSNDHSDPMVTYSHPKMTYSYPKVT